MSVRRMLQIDATGVQVATLAQEALDECDGDRVAAMACLRRWLRGDEALYKKLLRALVEDAEAEAVSLAWEKRHKHLTAVASPRPDRGAAGIGTLVQMTIMDFTLPDGQKIGDASAHALEAAEYHYATTARHYAGLRDWMGLVRAALGAADRVRDVLGEGDLLALRERAERQVTPAEGE